LSVEGLQLIRFYVRGCCIYTTCENNMSDEEASRSGSEEDEEEDEEEEEEEEADESEGENEEDKRIRVLQDIETMQSIFRYIDDVGKRSSDKRKLQLTIDGLQAANDQLEAKAQHFQKIIDNQQMEIGRLTEQNDDENNNAEYRPPR
jgi:hypothetical protein